jgi:acyl-CoA oxidase
MLEFGIIKASSLPQLRESTQKMASHLLADSLQLTDAFNFSDWELGSTLGRRDGNVYEHMYKEAEEMQHLSVDDDSYKKQVLQILKIGAKAERQAKL